MSTNNHSMIDLEKEIATVSNDAIEEEQYNANVNYSCLERVLQGKQRIWGREVCWIECNGLSGFIKEDKVY